MNCPETRGLIQVYMDSELEARDTLEVQRHLEMCSPCNRTVQTLTEQDEKLRSAAREEVVNSAGLRARVLQDIRTGSRPGIRDARRPSVLQRRFSVGVRGASRWGMLARAAAVLVAAGLVVFVLLKTGVLRGAQNSAVYAEAIEDHHDHCMLENTDKRMYTDAAKINHLTLKFCRLNAPMDLSSIGLAGARARLCGLEGKAYLHLLYFKSGEPNDGSMHQGISFFVRADNSAPSKPLNIDHMDGLVVGSMSRPGMSVVVVSPFSEDETKRAMTLALSELAATTPQ